MLLELVSCCLGVVRELSNSSLTVVIEQYSSLRIPIRCADNIQAITLPLLYHYATIYTGYIESVCHGDLSYDHKAGAFARIKPKKPSAVKLLYSSFYLVMNRRQRSQVTIDGSYLLIR
jgi:hypothetical protein